MPGAVRTASELVERAADPFTGAVLPLRAELAALLPGGGLRRGSTVTVRGSTSLLVMLLADATAERGWAAVVGMPDLGLLSAAESGVQLHRLALIPGPGSQIAEVLGALFDGFGLVAVAGGVLPGGQPGATLARRLSARARHRGAVLVSTGPWPVADLELTCSGARWEGLGTGWGSLRRCEADIVVRGKGAASRPRRGRLELYERRPLPGFSAPLSELPPLPGPWDDVPRGGVVERAG